MAYRFFTLWVRWCQKGLMSYGVSGSIILSVAACTPHHPQSSEDKGTHSNSTPSVAQCMAVTAQWQGDGSAKVRFQQVRNAANSGDAAAQYILATIYETGFMSVGDAHTKSSLKVIAPHVDQAFTQYMHLYERDQNPCAAYAAGLLIVNKKGTLASEKTLEEGVALVRFAADAGHAAARNSVGYFYRRGIGVDIDDAMALKWYRLAAEQGEAKAQLNMGNAAFYGLGMPIAFRDAGGWYRLAAGQGNAGAQNNLGIIYTYGYGVDMDHSAAVRWFRMAAEQGEPNAQFNLGLAYEEGRGVVKNMKIARSWYKKAATQGNQRARLKLEQRGGH